MAIDKTIYNNGIKGNLSYWEIDSLPKDYEVFKAMFKEATEIKEGKRKTFDTIHVFEPTYPKPMSKLEEEKRFMQVLTRASYGMSRENEFLKCTDYGVMTKWQRFKMKVKFVFNIKKWWNLFMLKRELKKNWNVDRKRYKEAAKELKAFRKEMEKKYGTDDLSYNMDRGEWTPQPGC